MMAGCLLFSDPVNKAPTVAITHQQDPLRLVRYKTARFEADAVDDDQSKDTLMIDWYRDKICTKVLAGSAIAPNLGLAPFQFIPTELGPGCVAVVVTDKHGATATAIQTYEVVDQPPVAALEIQSAPGLTLPQAGQPLQLPLYAQVTLSGKESKDPDGDSLTYLWSVYTDDEKQLLVATCPDNDIGVYACTFSADTPGRYHVELVVLSNEKSSVPPAVQYIDVAGDQLPNIVIDSAQPKPQTSPDDSPIILFASWPNTFTITQVEDDGDPYPPIVPWTTGEESTAGFVWFYRVYSTGSELFHRLDGISSSSFTIPIGFFHPQETIQVRVEYRDRVTACQPRNTGCDAVFSACGSGATICYSSDQLRVQWVTWTVTFR
jgi:hypothetical protein